MGINWVARAGVLARLALEIPVVLCLCHVVGGRSGSGSQTWTTRKIPQLAARSAACAARKHRRRAGRRLASRCTARRAHGSTSSIAVVRRFCGAGGASACRPGCVTAPLVSAAADDQCQRAHGRSDRTTLGGSMKIGSGDTVVMPRIAAVAALDDGGDDCLLLLGCGDCCDWFAPMDELARHITFSPTFERAMS
jgi:hypothetical protein